MQLKDDKELTREFTGPRRVEEFDYFVGSVCAREGGSPRRQTTKDRSPLL
jgi:hypothetical protein